MTSPLATPGGLLSHQRRLSLLYQISRDISGRLELTELLPRILKATVENTQANTGSVIVFDERETVTHSALMKDGKFEPDPDKTLGATIKEGLAGWVVHHQQAALIPNTAEDVRWHYRPDDSRIGPKSAIAVPLPGRERVVGVLTVVRVLPGAFNKDDLSLLVAIADQAGIAIENAELFAAERRRREINSTLREILHRINATLNLNEVLPLVLDQLARVIVYDSASIFLREETHLRIAAARGFANVAALMELTFETNWGFAARVMQERRLIILPDAQAAPDWASIALPNHRPIRSWIGVPLLVKDEVIGLLTVDNLRPDFYTDEDAELVAVFAEQAATAILHARRFADLQAAENRFAGLFEDSIDPILITDVHGLITDANRKAAQFFGYTRTELIGQRVTTVHRTGTGFLGSQRFHNLTGGEEIAYQTRITTKAGVEIPVEVHAKRIERRGQEFIQWIQHDLSERIALEELRNDFISMIIHDLRSPLGNIISSLDIVQTTLTVDDETVQSILRVAGRSAKRLSRLIDSLLDLRRLESGSVTLHREPFDLVTLFAEVIEQVAHTAQERAIALNVSCPPQLPPVLIDVDMIRRVLVNLVDNAIKYMPGPGQIMLTATLNPQNMEIRVSDTGPGIPASEQQRIFQRFARIRRENAPRGVGLGLAFCRLAVEAHGGQIWVESQPGQGANFKFTLPIT